MISNVKKVRNIKHYLTEFSEGQNIRIAVPANEISLQKIKDLGFSEDLITGERLLPSADLSKSCFENSEGKCVVRRDLPKEIAERYWEWTWEDWGGNSHYDYTYIPYSRYVREYLSPMTIELVVANTGDGGKWISTDPIKYTAENIERLKLAANLMLSLFGCCYPVDLEFTIPILANRTCDWEILKSGHKMASEVIDKIIRQRAPEGKQNMYRRNIKKLLADNSPDVVAVGTKGFSGYLVFVYSGKDTVVLESLMPNNATYILNKDWELISKLSKSEILARDLYVDRIFHYRSWEEKIDKYINGNINHRMAI